MEAVPAGNWLLDLALMECDLLILLLFPSCQHPFISHIARNFHIIQMLNFCKSNSFILIWFTLVVKDSLLLCLFVSSVCTLLLLICWEFILSCYCCCSTFLQVCLPFKNVIVVSFVSVEFFFYALHSRKHYWHCNGYVLRLVQIFKLSSD